MAPKRKSGAGTGRGRGRPKKAKTDPQPAPKDAANTGKSGPPDLSGKETYCSEVGIDIQNGGSQAVYQWLCCSIIFGNRISEKTTIRAAKGLINSGLTDPKSVKDASWQEKIDALNSEGNVQRGPSMSSRLEDTAALVLEKYEGDLEKLREAANKDPEEIRKLVKEFKGIGETGVNIFFREAQLQWEELFPFADDNSLELAKSHGYPSKDAKELAEFVNNDRKNFVALLAALTKDELRGTKILEGESDKKGNDKADNEEKDGKKDGTKGDKSEAKEDKKVEDDGKENADQAEENKSGEGEKEGDNKEQKEVEAKEDADNKGAD